MLRGLGVAAGLFLAVLSAGCIVVESDGDEDGQGEDGEGGEGEGGSSVEEGAPQLFVVNRNGGVMSFANPAEIEGRAEPTTSLAAGAETDMYGPRDLALSSTGDLFVASENDAAVVIYADAADATGPMLPTRKLKGSLTGLDVPVSLALDSKEDVLYVVNSASNGAVDNAIFAFDGASTIDGNVEPSRRIDVARDDFSPLQMVVHEGELYVVSQGDNTARVLVFEDAGALQGSVSPTRTIENASWGQVLSIAIDAEDRMLAVDDEAQLFVYEHASHTPSATYDVQGASKLSAIAFDSKGDMFLADSSLALVYSFGPSWETGSAIAPARSFDSVTLTLPSRMAVLEQP